VTEQLPEPVSDKRPKFGGVRRGAPDGRVEPFPLERFMAFIKVLRVQTRDFGLQPLRLLGSQLYILDEICRGLAEGITTFVILKARQLGASTLFLALDLFWAFEHRGLLGVFATHDEGSRDQFRAQITLFLKTLPKTHRVLDEHHNRLMLILKNSSQFRYLIAGTKTTTNKLGRSGGCNFLHATEVAFWGSADDIASLNQTLSELYPHRLYIYETTANGFNHFADTWEIAKESPAQKAIFVGWWRNELYEFGDDHPLYLKYMPQGRRTPLTPIERRRVKAVKDLYGYAITSGQIAWYRHHLETKCKGDQAMMDQEMPWTEDDAFVSTGAKFFTDESLTYQMREARKAKCMPFVFRLTQRWEEIAVQRSSINNCELKIWEQPSPFGKYVIGCDPAYGSSPDADRSVICVGRAYADRVVQVAEFASPSASTYQCAWVLAYLAGLYRDVMVNLEITGPGTAVFQELNMLRQRTAEMVSTDKNADLRNCLSHMRHFLYSRPDSPNAQLAYQWRSTAETKIWLMNRFKDGFELNRVQIFSLGCLDEMRGVVLEEGSVEATGRRKDDRPVAAALMFWAWEKWVQPKLIAEGLTWERSQQIEKQGGEDPVDGLVRRFMQARGIRVKDRDQ